MSIKLLKEINVKFPRTNDKLNISYAKYFNIKNERKGALFESRYKSILVKDADNLEWILALKEEIDTGNKRALLWITSAIDRLKTKDAKDIAKEIMSTDSNDWWFDEKSQKSKWWVNRDKKQK